MSRRKKKKRKRKSRSKDSAPETKEKMGVDELEDLSEAHDSFNAMTATAVNRFHPSEEPTGILDDGRCTECLMDCGKTRSHSLNKPMDFRFHLRVKLISGKSF